MKEMTIKEWDDLRDKYKKEVLARVFNFNQNADKLTDDNVWDLISMMEKVESKRDDLTQWTMAEAIYEKLEELEFNMEEFNELRWIDITEDL